MYLSRRLRFSSQYDKEKLIAKLLFFLTGAVIFGFIIIFILFAWYAKDLPSPSKLSQQTGYSTVFYDRDGKVLYDMYKDKNRVPVTFEEIPKTLKEATIAIEDKNFYKHGGFSQTGMIRAFLNMFLGRGLQGGSTITQQLIKNVLLTNRQTITRKVQEMILAFEVERRYKKDEILLMYLNESPYGGTYWGVGTAAKAYFGKSAKDLNLVESAILAGLPQSPSLYSPFIGKNDAWKTRTKSVLRRMREDGYITKDQENTALKKVEITKFNAPKILIEAPHFVFFVKDQIEQEYGSKIIDKGVKIKTTLSLEVQQTAEKIVKEEIAKLKDFNATNAAVVVLDSKTGEVLAMVGSYDFNDEKFGKFNVAELGLRQPGSALKPFTYGLAFEKGYNPSTIFMDVKTTFPDQGAEDYSPVNYDGKFRGPVQLRFALGNSINIPAVKLLSVLGLRDFLTKLDDLGMPTFAPNSDNLKRFGLSLTLGGGETTLLNLTSAYSVLANGGLKHDINSIADISDFKGKNIFKKVRIQEKRVFSSEVSFLLSHILSDNNARLDEFGPNSYLNVPGKTVAAKTGTTDDKRDNWTVGYTKSITVGVWVGNNDNSKMNPKIASGATGASPIWYRIMRELLKKYDDGIMDKPDKVKALTIDAFLGGLPKDGYPTRSEYFIEGSEPKDTSPWYKKLKISKSNGKLANEVEVKSGNYEEKDFIVISESDPVSTDGKNRWQEAINAWAGQQGDNKFKPPTETSDASSDSVIVSIKSPSGQTTVSSGNLNIKAKIISLDKLKNVKIKLNGEIKFDWSEDKRDIDETVSIIADGVYELQIIGTNEKDKQGESTIKFGVNKPWDYVTPAP
ncbi:MAG: Penicillin-binding protein, 1A family [Candidatus Roizmanbacteria bacterium GW2011_GWC2_34_23]|uniref:Penicillin-binding protein, 1A family n=1 Tax=Candidatus Roizmanbacteria bacterium GW2011_GWC2_34_23 TaxID=1618484 RepID=A0A0G0BBS6_9BACT|nr:MAG: Penicillin-binding protein, 1A family [Candidatus Roizmanbacteria bacterium GW2011_GWC2_34_23]